MTEEMRTKVMDQRDIVFDDIRKALSARVAQVHPSWDELEIRFWIRGVVRETLHL